MRILFVATGLCGFISVAAGAFGAHALKDQLTAQALGWWETATFYLLVHAVAALAALTIPAVMATDRRVHDLNIRRTRMVAVCFLIGGLIFAGSLYAMAMGGPRWFGAITPVGGLILLLGWASVIWIGIRST